MALKLYDTLSRSKKALRAPEPGKPITLYLCGPTVYGRAHIGNARGPVVFDVLYRLLRHLHGAENVRYARNITDIDDKIMAKAVAENRGPQAVAAEFEAAYFEDMGALGCLMPDFNPRATDHIAGAHGMVAMIAALIARGVAYEASGHVLFEVAKFDGYGALSKRPMDEMIAGARVEVAPYKRAPGDFVLWKPSREDQPGWESPWGRGRPGWHIECSAMIRGVLETDTIDIHGGGIDLTFPHHENERAQSCCAHGGAELARIWMHNGFLTMGETKMSKSIGNIITPRELLDAGWDGEVLRLALLSAHYRQPLSWTDELLEQSSKIYEKFCSSFHFLDPDEQSSEATLSARPEVIDALSDDLGFKRAFDAIHVVSGQAKDEWAKITAAESGNPLPVAVAERRAASDVERQLRQSLNVLGIDARLDRSRNFSDAVDGILRHMVEAELSEYRNARAAKDWSAADAIRDTLKADGIEISVAKDGTVTWRKA